MKKEVTIVPTDKCPLDVLAELGERTKHAWIYLHENAVSKLEKSCNSGDEIPKTNGIMLTWSATDEFPETSIIINKGEIGPWKPVYIIEADDIAFHCMEDDPEEIFFLKMEE